jgi:hypothetical protein
LTTGEIFEIKSAPQVLAGNVQLQRYVDNATTFCGIPPTWQRGNSIFPVGEANAVKRTFAFNGKKYLLQFWMSPAYNGVVLYRLDEMLENDPWYNFVSLPDAIDALRLLLAASITQVKKIKVLEDIETVREKIEEEVEVAIKRLNTPVLKNLLLLVGTASAATILSAIIPGNQLQAAVVTMFMGVVGVTVYNELKNRPEN